MRYRITESAQADILAILAWSLEQFGEEARGRYGALIAAAIRDVASDSRTVGAVLHPELGEGVFTWHLSKSRGRSSGARVRQPRHFLVCRQDADALVIGRVLHDAMDLRRHIDRESRWD